MQVTKNFVLQEFVNPEYYKIFGDRALEFMDIRIIQFAQAFRDLVGKPITINNWHTGGQYVDSGLRTFGSSTGAPYSQHKYGRAVDIKVAGMTGEQMRQLVKDNYSTLFFPYITTIEDGTDTWLHADCRYTGRSELNIVPFYSK